MRYLLVLIATISTTLFAQDFDIEALRKQDSRYCGTPAKDLDGSISRSTVVIKQFKQAHPCPATGKTDACPGWDIDHVIPLACGGCDKVENMQWLPHIYKITGKDRWERKVYDKGIPSTRSCSNEIVIILDSKSP
jgi:hypothetical protein